MFTFPSTFIAGPKSVLISTWDTEKLGGTGSATKVLLLPMSAGNTIDWGDGTINNLNTHTYASGGVKTVKIFGKITGFRFNNGGDKLKLTDVSDVGGLVIDNSAVFYGCANLTWSATNAPSVTTTNLTNTFRGGTVFNGAIGNWPMGGVTLINTMIRDCPAFNQSINAWDVSSVTGAGNFLFAASIYNQTMNLWVTSSLITADGMLRNTAFNQDISAWPITSVTTMINFLNGSAFSATNYDLLLPAWEAQSVQNNVTAHFGSATYGAGTPATARAALIADHTWTITDGGPT